MDYRGCPITIAIDKASSDAYEAKLAVGNSDKDDAVLTINILEATISENEADEVCDYIERLKKKPNELEVMKRRMP